MLLFLQKGLLVHNITAVSNNFRPVHTDRTVHVIQPQQGISIEFSFDAFTWQRKVPAVRKWTSFSFYTVRWLWVLESYKAHLSFPPGWQLSGCGRALPASLLCNKKCLDNISAAHEVWDPRKLTAFTSQVQTIILNGSA